MPDLAVQAIPFPAPVGSISSSDWCAGSYGAQAAGYDSFTNGSFAANKAIYIPFSLNEILTVTGFGWLNGTTAGNADAGVYDEAGTRLVSIGSTVVTGTSVVQTASASATTLKPGNYFLAFATSSATATFSRINMAAVAQEALGCKQEAVFPLPSSASFAAPSTLFYPRLAAFTATVF